ncbi:MAG: STN domain-containing protein, partial [Prevotellaceae bacterium]|nr:STN domain-containing protein [Prevotellaceae bacterium]
MKRKEKTDGKPIALSHQKKLSAVRSWTTGMALIVMQCVAFSALFAQNARVTLNLKDVPITGVFQEIKEQTQMSIVYNVGDVETIQRVSVEASNERVSSVLDRLLRNTDLTYSIENKYIIFAKKGSKPVEQAPSPEPITVKGTVVDKNGTPLIGVS